MPEVHAIDRCNQRWRHQHHGHHRKQLDDLVLFGGDHTKRRIQQKADAFRQRAQMITERRRIAAHCCNAISKGAGRASDL